jgi:hypothetical protein
MLERKKTRQVDLTRPNFRLRDLIKGTQQGNALQESEIG